MNKYTKLSGFFSACLFLLVLSSNIAYAQPTAITMTLQNAVQTSATTFEYDVILTNTGATALALRGYSCGINHTSGMNGTGTITHTFVSRDASLANIPVVSPGYTASSSHLRFTTVNATAGNEVLMPVGVPFRIATMRVTNSLNFPANFNPGLNLQTITASGKTQCIATCIVTPPGSTFSLNGAGNAATSGTLQVLTGVVNTPCFYLNPSSVYAATKTSSTNVTCSGLTNGSATITLSGTGSTSTGTYTINGGSAINFSSNPFTISNLAAGTYTIAATSANGCVDTALAIITQPVGASSATACNSYTWTGTTYTASGVYTKSFALSAGCDSTHTLTLTINPSYNTTTNITAANSYTWSANGITYTNSGVYTINLLTAAGCDSIKTLNLNIITVNVSNDQDISCHGANDGTVLAHAVGASGNFTYDLDGANLFTNTTGYFFNLTPGSHTVCAKESVSNVIVCGSAIILEPDPLTATFTVDSVASCVGNHGQLSLNISGGTANNQPYLTLWKNASGDTLNNQLTDNYATTVSNLPAGNYTVRIEDDHACVINVNTTLAPAICDVTLNLKAFIQGYYLGGSLMTATLLNEGVSSNPNLTDTILVERHAGSSPFALIDSKKALLLTNGTATCSFPPSASPCYIVIKHRNGLETWSASPLSFTTGTFTYDFTNAANKAYGSNQIQLASGIFGIYSGDIIVDENVDLLDLSSVEGGINSFEFGYTVNDINGDGNVDLLDSPVIEENVNNFVFSSHP